MARATLSDAAAMTTLAAMALIPGCEPAFGRLECGLV
jgi:hypothetical protein